MPDMRELFRAAESVANEDNVKWWRDECERLETALADSEAARVKAEDMLVECDDNMSVDGQPFGDSRGMDGHPQSYGYVCASPELTALLSSIRSRQSQTEEPK